MHDFMSHNLASKYGTKKATKTLKHLLLARFDLAPATFVDLVRLRHLAKAYAEVFKGE
jgi:hypothetical protein